jgi:hypothetical protein
MLTKMNELMNDVKERTSKRGSVFCRDVGGLFFVFSGLDSAAIKDAYCCLLSRDGESWPISVDSCIC